MEYPKFLVDFAEENGLEIIDVVEDNYKEGVALFAIFDGPFGQEVKRIDENKEIVLEN